MSISSFFKKLGRQISSPFKKGGAVSNVFKKGGVLAKGVSKGLSFVSKGLAKAGDIGSKILKSPITTAIVGGLAPELLPEVELGGRALIAGLKAGSKLAGAGSRLTDVDSYKKVKSVGDFLENVDDASRRALEVKGAGEEAGISFA
jgi:hypothetical protein